MILVRFLDLKFLHTRAAIMIGNFKSTALADAARHHGGTLIGPRPARFAQRNAPQDRRNHAVAPRVPAIRAKSQNIA